jgi:hypothetical protein
MFSSSLVSINLLNNEITTTFKLCTFLVTNTKGRKTNEVFRDQDNILNNVLPDRLSTVSQKIKELRKLTNEVIDHHISPETNAEQQLSMITHLTDSYSANAWRGIILMIIRLSENPFFQPYIINQAGFESSIIYLTARLPSNTNIIADILESHLKIVTSIDKCLREHSTANIMAFKEQIYLAIMSIATALFEINDRHSLQRKEQLALQCIETLRHAHQDKNQKQQLLEVFVFDLMKCRIMQGWAMEAIYLHEKYKLGIDDVKKYYHLSEKLIELGFNKAATYFLKKCTYLPMPRRITPRQKEQVELLLASIKPKRKPVHTFAPNHIVHETTSASSLPVQSPAPSIGKQEVDTTDIPPLEPKIKIKTRGIPTPEEEAAASTTNDPNQSPYTVLFPQFSQYQITSFTCQGVPEGIYCGYFDIANPLQSATTKITDFHNTFQEARIVGSGMNGFVLSKSKNSELHHVKIKRCAEDLRLHGIPRAITIDQEGRKHYLYQFGLFKTHKELDRNGIQEPEIEAIIHHDMRQSKSHT